MRPYTIEYGAKDEDYFKGFHRCIMGAGNRRHQIGNMGARSPSRLYFHNGCNNTGHFLVLLNFYFFLYSTKANRPT
jgi:hypothetical protein